jgi:hypothetical protein
MDGDPKADEYFKFESFRFQYLLAQSNVFAELLHIIIVNILESHIFDID